jgi:hypothetical protein
MSPSRREKRDILMIGGQRAITLEPQGPEGKNTEQNKRDSKKDGYICLSSARCQRRRELVGLTRCKPALGCYSRFGEAECEEANCGCDQNASDPVNPLGSAGREMRVRRYDIVREPKQASGQAGEKEEEKGPAAPIRQLSALSQRMRRLTVRYYSWLRRSGFRLLLRRERPILPFSCVRLRVSVKTDQT